MSDDRFEEFLQRAARGYNEPPPPPPPRDAMWARIDAERRSRRSTIRSPWASRRTWWVMATGMAATLLLGIGLGTYWHRGGAGTPAAPPTVTAHGAGGPAATPGSASSPAVQTFDAVAAEHLGRAEVLLTSFQVESQRGAVDPKIGTWAGDLLSTTRLLLDSPSARDPQMRKLLGDLEVVLAQIAQLNTQRAPTTDDLQLIDRAVHAHDMMTRLRNATPPAGGAIATGT